MGSGSVRMWRTATVTLEAIHINAFPERQIIACESITRHDSTVKLSTSVDGEVTRNIQAGTVLIRGVSDHILFEATRLCFCDDDGTPREFELSGHGSALQDGALQFILKT